MSHDKGEQLFIQKYRDYQLLVNYSVFSLTDKLKIEKFFKNTKTQYNLRVLNSNENINIRKLSRIQSIKTLKIMSKSPKRVGDLFETGVC